MRVLIANKFFYMRGGAERVMFAERSYIKRMNSTVIDFSMKDPRNLPSDYSTYFVSNVDYGSQAGVLKRAWDVPRFIRSSEALAKLRALIRLEKPDIAHLHNVYHHLTPAIIPLLKSNRIPVVLTLHDGKLICPSYLMLNRGSPCTECGGEFFRKALTLHCTGSWSHELLLAAEAYWHRLARSYEGVDLFISPSRFLADLVSKRVPPEKLRVLPNGVDVGAYPETYTDGQYCLFLGRLSAEKGVTTLLEAHAAASGSLPLVVAGSGPLEMSLRARYTGAVYLGHQTGPELDRTICGAAFVVVPSESYENCPMAILEAMSMAKPVVASDIGGIPELVEDGKTGLLFEPGNVKQLAERLTLLSQNKDLRRSLGVASRAAAVERFSLDVHCAGLEGIYDEVLRRTH